MALLISKTGLKNQNGGSLITEPIIVRFAPIGQMRGIGMSFNVSYFLDETYKEIEVIEEVETELEGEQVVQRKKLPHSFTSNSTPIEVMEMLEQIQAPNPLVQWTILYHNAVKTHLESVLGAGTVTIDIQL